MRQAVIIVNVLLLASVPALAQGTHDQHTEHTSSPQSSRIGQSSAHTNRPDIRNGSKSRTARAK